MERNSSPSGRDPDRGDPSPGLFAAFERGDRQFSFGRKLLIGLGIFFIVGAVALVAYKAITEASAVFQRGADRFEAVE